MNWTNSIRLRERLRTRWLLLKRSRRATDRLKVGEWTDRLENEKKFLLSLIQNVETEFLAIGREFEGWAQQLNGIQQECRSLSELTLGRAQEAPVQFAFQLLKKAEALVLASYDQYDNVFATFVELQQRLAQLSHRHDELMRTLMPITFISMSIRIEASRQPPEIQEIFSMLAANVCRTVSEVRITLEQQFAELAASERIAGAVIEQIASSIQRHRQEVNAAMKTNRAQLNALNEAILAAGAGTENLVRLNQAVSCHLSDLVMAQQCQDITRQKIEHVGEAMDEMRVQLSGIRTAAPAAKSGACQFVFQAARIQLMQSQSVFDELIQAAESRKLGIQDLRTDAEAATDVVVKVGETMRKANVAHECEVSMGQIIVMIRQAIQKTVEILTALEPLQTRFLNCTQQATALANDVRLAALNAQIFAIHTPHGATLEVLAGNMRTTSDDTVQHVEELGSGLQQTVAMINNLRQRLADFKQLAQAQQTLLTEETAISQAKLLNLDRAIPLLIGRITQQQTAFAQSADSILAKIRYPAKVAVASEHSIGFFQELVAWSEKNARSLSVESACPKIDSLRTKYTMASERNAHAAVMNFADPAIAPVQPSVKLFDELTPSPPAIALRQSQIVIPSAAGCNLLPTPESKETTAPLPTRPTSVPPLKPASNEELGDNVDLF